jgi:exopolysaccharide biosynthesis protein
MKRLIEKFKNLKEKLKKMLVTPTFETKEITNISNSTKKKASLKVLVAELIVEGNPLLIPDIVITMSGNLAKKHIGNWYIEKVTHKVTGKVFSSVISIVKNATEQEKNATEQEKKAKKTINKINESKGEPTQDVDDKIVIHVYDDYNNVIGGETKDGTFIKF